MNLDMFMQVDHVPWSDSHIAAITKHWGRLNKTTKIYEFNVKWYARVLSEDSNAHVLYVAGLNIPHLSKWAEVEAKKRGLLK